MFRRFIALLISVTLCWTTAACSSAPTQAKTNFNNNVSTATRSTPLSSGAYPVQQATYDDATGEYTLMLLNTPPGTSSIFRSDNLQMARLTDEQIASGEKTHLEVNGAQAVMYLTEDFKIEYVHNVTDTQINPQTGEPETVIVRQRSSFWTPFAGALAGQALGSLLFTPQYYVPPVYQPGRVLTGYGGYGRSYNQAVNRYQSRYQAPPAAVKNRRVLRTTGGLRTPSTSTRRRTNLNNRPTGSGYGSSNLPSSSQYRSKRTRSSSRFGSSYGRRRSFSGSRRRR